MFYRSSNTSLLHWYYSLMQYKWRHLQGNSRQVPLSAIKDEEGCRSKVEGDAEGRVDTPEGEASPSAAVTDRLG
jgi:hypothetical protein